MVATQPRKIFVVVGADMYNKRLAFLAMDVDKETAENVAEERRQNNELLKKQNADIQYVYTLEMIDDIDSTQKSFDKLEAWLIETVKLTREQALFAIASFGARFLNTYEEICNELID